MDDNRSLSRYDALQASSPAKMSGTPKWLEIGNVLNVELLRAADAALNPTRRLNFALDLAAVPYLPSAISSDVSKPAIWLIVKAPIRRQSVSCAKEWRR